MKAKKALLALFIAVIATMAPVSGCIPGQPTVPSRCPPASLMQSTSAVASSESWDSPVPLPLTIGRKFDPPHVRWQAGHRGVDVCPGVGTAVRSPRAGTVIYAGPLAGRNVISIRHGDGLRTTFEPVKPQVQKNDFVSQGSVVGILEAGHEKDCLHWGVKVNRDRYLNPIVLLFGEPVLKPWDEPDA
ncbi:MAG: peptidoglycan DD-metalloendopeptidase family protein [Actinomycetaceae bacterium]|nr:peptidoglycan DD-metalloendopeptidase family protein [Actinomycetaceae bacterium]